MEPVETELLIKTVLNSQNILYGVDNNNIKQTKIRNMLRVVQNNLVELNHSVEVFFQ